MQGSRQDRAISSVKNNSKRNSKLQLILLWAWVSRYHACSVNSNKTYNYPSISSFSFIQCLDLLGIERTP